MPPAGAVLRLERYRTGGGQAGNVAPRPGPGAEDERPVRGPGGEPGAGRRRRRGRVARPTRRPAARCCCAPGAGRSPRRTSRSWPATWPRRRPGCTAWPSRGPAGRGPGAGGAARGQRRRRPDPSARTSIRTAADAGADQPQPRRAPAGRHPAAGPAAGLRLADRGGQPQRPAALRPDRGAQRGAAGALPALPPVGRRAGRHRLAVRASVQSHEVHAALARIPGVDMAREVRVALFPAEAGTGRRGRGDGAARPADDRARLLLRAPGAGDPVRGTVRGLPSPHPLADTLPSMLREDPFARGLCASLDEVLAPVLLSLDTFDSLPRPGDHPRGHAAAGSPSGWA